MSINIHLCPRHCLSAQPAPHHLGRGLPCLMRLSIALLHTRAAISAPMCETSSGDVVGAPLPRHVSRASRIRSPCVEKVRTCGLFFSSRHRHETAWRKGEDKKWDFEGDLVLFLLKLPFKLANVHELTHPWWRRVNLAGSAAADPGYGV